MDVEALEQLGRDFQDLSEKLVPVFEEKVEKFRESLKNDKTDVICCKCKKEVNIGTGYQCLCGEYFCEECCFTYIGYTTCPKCKQFTLLEYNLREPLYLCENGLQDMIYRDYLEPLQFTSKLIFMGLYFRNESGKLVMPKLLKLINDGGVITSDLYPSLKYFRNDLLKFRYRHDSQLELIEKYGELSRFIQSVDMFRKISKQLITNLENLKLSCRCECYDGKNKFHRSILEIKSILGVFTDRDCEFMEEIMKKLSLIAPSILEMTCSDSMLEVPNFKNIFTEIFRYFVESDEMHHEFVPSAIRTFKCKNCSSDIEHKFDYKHSYICESCGTEHCRKCLGKKEGRNHICRDYLEIPHTERYLPTHTICPKCCDGKICGGYREFKDFAHCGNCIRFYKTNHRNYGGRGNDKYARFFHYQPSPEDLLTVAKYIDPDNDHNYWIDLFFEIPRNSLIELMKIDYDKEFIDVVLKLYDYYNIYDSHKDKLIDIFYSFVRKNNFVVDEYISSSDNPIFTSLEAKRLVYPGLIICNHRYGDGEHQISDAIKNKDIEYLKNLIKNIQRYIGID